MSDIIEVDESNWNQTVTQSVTPVLVDFYATWCGPCKQLHPTIERLAGKYKGRAKVCQVDVDQNSNLARKLVVQAMPTVFVFPPGSEQPDKKFVGVKAESEYSQALDNLIPLWGEGDKGSPEEK